MLLIDNTYSQLFENTNIKSYEDDVHKIISQLTKKEKEYIGNGYWVDSDHVIYRKVKYLENNPVAFIDIYYLPKFERTGLIIIATIKQSRGLGIGKNLVNSAINEFKNNKNINKLRWLVDIDNKASIAMAKSLGFKYNGRIKDNYFEYYYYLK